MNDGRPPADTARLGLADLLEPLLSGCWEFEPDRRYKIDTCRLFLQASLSVVAAEPQTSGIYNRCAANVARRTPSADQSPWPHSIASYTRYNGSSVIPYTPLGHVYAPPSERIYCSHIWPRTLVYLLGTHLPTQERPYIIIRLSRSPDSEGIRTS